MNISSIGGTMLSNSMQATKNAQQSLSTNSLKNVMDTPKQFLDLLEQSIAVNNTKNIASSLGMIVDRTG